MLSYLTAREQELCRRRAKLEKLLAWKQKLDDEETEIERLEKEAVQGATSRRASSVNDSVMSGESNHIQNVTRRHRQSATAVNSSLVEDPTIRLPSFDLHRCQWSLLNRFRTGQGHCNACRKKWGFTDNELCDCGETQTMSHIVNSCALTKFDGGLTAST